MHLPWQLWRDEQGAILSLEIVLAGTILGIGTLAGLASLRDGVITELADVGGAIAWIDQGYVLHGVKAHSAATPPTMHFDQRDYCDDGVTTTAERCLVICNGTFAMAPPGNEEGLNNGATNGLTPTGSTSTGRRSGFQ